MQHTMSRTLLVAVTSAGLVLGGAVSAGASDKDKDKDEGRVKVCQLIEKKKDKDKDKDWKKDDKKYTGIYKVNDSKGKPQWVTLTGKDVCKTVKVDKGWVKVSVKDLPKGTELKDDDDAKQKVWVGKDKKKTVTFEYWKVKKDKKD